MTNVSEQDRRSDRAGQDAIKRLSQPVKGRIVVAQACTVLSALLSFVPYLALVQLGDLFLGAQAAGQPVDAARAHEVVSVLVMAFLSQLFFRALALIITHFADRGRRAR